MTWQSGSTAWRPERERLAQPDVAGQARDNDS